MADTKMSNEIMDARTAAGYLYMSMPTLYAHTSKKMIPYYKRPNGKKLYFKKSELDEWLFSNRIQTTDEADTMIATDMAKRKGR